MTTTPALDAIQESLRRERRRSSAKSGLTERSHPIATYTLVLKAMPSSVPPEIRLRAALKSLRRQFGLRCTSVNEVQS